MCVEGGVGVEGEVVVAGGVVVAVGADHGDVGGGHAGRIQEGGDEDGRVGWDRIRDWWSGGGGGEVVDEKIDGEQTEDDIAEELEVASTGIGSESGVHAGEGGWVRGLARREGEVHTGEMGDVIVESSFGRLVEGIDMG